jgi:uncharacterized Zn finger protein
MAVVISHSSLKKLAGAAAYECGACYFADGHVLDAVTNGKRVDARVQGSGLYHVRLNLSGRELEGACDCPVSEGMDFCKHCVAVGLYLLREQEEIGTLEKGSETDRIKAYLLQRPKEELVNQLVDFIALDKRLRQRYALRLTASERGIDFKALRKQITAATPSGRHLYRYPQVRAYFAKVEELTDYLPEVAAAANADSLIDLVLYALQRIGKALETVDDSGGFRLSCVAQLNALHQQLLMRSRMTPIERAHQLVQLLLSEQGELLDDIPFAYSDALGHEGEAAFWQRLQAAWDAVPAPRSRSEMYSGHAPRLAYLLRQRSEATGDYAGELSIRVKCATDEYDFLRLAQFCFEHEHYRDAESWLQKVEASNARDTASLCEPVLTLRMKIYCATGQLDESVRCAWQLFETVSTFENYLLLKQTLVDAKSQEGTLWAEKAIDHLDSRWQRELNILRRRRSGYTLTAPSALILILMDSGDLARAWELANEGAPEAVLIALADASWGHRADDAVNAYRRVIEHSIDRTDNAAYARAIDYLDQLGNRMREQKIVGFEQYLSEIAVRYKAKRNFSKLLRERLS